MTGAHLSKSLRDEHKKRSIQPRVGDSVKVMRGTFKGKTGKVAASYPQIAQCEIEGIEREKVDGSKVRVSLANSNLLVLELNYDSKRSVFKGKKPAKKKAAPKKESTPKKEDKPSPAGKAKPEKKEDKTEVKA